MKKQILIFSIACLLLFVVVGTGFVLYGGMYQSEPWQVKPAPTITDISAYRCLDGVSPSVFSATGTTTVFLGIAVHATGTLPQEFQVRVLNNIFGKKLAGDVTVGWSDYEHQGDIVPAIGQKFIFSAHYESAKNWYHFSWGETEEQCKRNVAHGLSYATESARQATTRKPIVISEGDALFVRDLNNDRNLMGDSHNVFAGTVINETKSLGSDTFFDVRVIKNIKGNLQGNASVHVTGGYRDGNFYVMDGSAWLAPGSTYLLATRSGGSFYHLISFPSAWKLLSQDQNLTDGQLSGVVENDSRVQQLEKAYTQEVPLPADVANNNAFNSYQSLTEAQKAALPYYVAPPPPPTPTSTVATSTASSTAN